MFMETPEQYKARKKAERRKPTETERTAFTLIGGLLITMALIIFGVTNIVAYMAVWPVVAIAAFNWRK